MAEPTFDGIQWWEASKQLKKTQAGPVQAALRSAAGESQYVVNHNGNVAGIVLASKQYAARLEVVEDSVRFTSPPNMTKSLSLTPPGWRAPDSVSGLTGKSSRCTNTTVVTADNAWPGKPEVAKAYKRSFASVVPIPEGTFAEVEAILTEYRRQFPVSKTQSRVVKVVSPKTHKTGSSTLGSVLFRYGARNKLRMFGKGNWAFFPYGTLSRTLKDPCEKGQYDLDFHHLTPNGNFRSTYASVEAFYKHITNESAPAKIAVIREPKSQLTSYAYYYHVPGNAAKDGGHEAAFMDFLVNNRTTNQVAKGFGLYSETAVRNFLADWLDTFTVMLLSERFDEGLVLARRLFNWDPLDITYVRLLDSHSKEGSRRWDGKKLFPTPKVASLPIEQQKMLDARTQWDQILYNAFKEKFDGQVAAQPSDFQEEVDLFKRLNRKLSEACTRAPKTGPCLFYSLTDMQYFRMISPVGYAPAWRLDGSSTLDDDGNIDPSRQ
eukprot:TRINITY_DN6200_c0_g1_i1.p1 TRINITY_DN6200_c0_g1~~TRINITY_DN6200_c0_g1_i1.p1  ORF type:complete len:536 (+),score=121.11 TRINITY_DN6200_c0_g1_i1:138-1610(+)